jgi:DnaA family protein
MSQSSTHVLPDPDQLPLRFKAKREVNFENYFTTQVSEAPTVVELLQQVLDPAQHSTLRVVYLFGETGSGKTHLLQAACADQFLRKKRTIYIPLSDIAEQQPEYFKQASVLEGLDLGHWSLIAMDQMDQLLKCSAFELQQWLQKLSSFLAKIREQNIVLILAGDIAWSDWPIAFRALFESLGLKSSNLIQQELWLLTPIEKLHAIQHLGKLSGMPLSESVASFLLETYDTQLPKAFDALEHVMRVAYLQKKSVTLPFVKQLFQLA